MSDIEYPYIQFSKSTGFYVMDKNADPLLLPDAITLRSAFTAASKLGYKINCRYWVDKNGRISPVLFTPKV
jgi:hypothetical protein